MKTITKTRRAAHKPTRILPRAAEWLHQPTPRMQEPVWFERHHSIEDVMKTRSSKYVRFLSILCWAALAVGPRASAQAPPVLDIQLYAGLSITGAVGTIYSVQYVTHLAQTNDWRCLTFLQLPATNYLW